MNTTTISSQEISKLADLMKIFKSDSLMIICNDHIFATDYRYAYIKHTTCSVGFLDSGRYYCYEIQYLSHIKSKDLYRVDMDMYGNLYIWLNGASQYIFVMNNTISPLVKDKILYCASLGNTIIPQLVFEDISGDDGIIQMRNSLAGDGVTMYRKAGYMMTLYKGLLPLNKGDILALEIYPDENNEYFTTKFTVIKKKLCVHIYLRFINLS